jgi:methyl-accepting chemotaxis protein
MSLVKKLIIVGVALTVLPLAVVGAGGWFSGRQAQAAATAGTVQLAHTDLEHVVQLVYTTCEVFMKERERQLADVLARAADIAAGRGTPEISGTPSAWQAKHQVSGEVTTVSLPPLRLGSTSFERVAEADRAVPVVDQILDASGASATVFQRMNAAGDMLRIATNVIAKDGRRAIGTYIPAVAQDGSANAVVATVLRGETFVGRAFVVDRWFLAGYRPLRDRAGAIVGMLFVGLPETTASNELLDKLKALTIGKTGYIYILNAKGSSRGAYVLSKDRKRDGENLWESRDAGGRPFIQDIVAKSLTLKPGELADMEYPWKNAGDAEAALKIAVFTYFAPWDWVIAASVPLAEYTTVADEVKAINRASSMLLLATSLLAAAVTTGIWLVFGRRLQRDLGPIVAELGQGARQVLGAAGQVASSAQALSQGSTEQAASLEETSASMEEMASMTRQNAEHCLKAATLMADVDARVVSSNQSLSAMVASMASIREASTKVSKIVKTIDEIAFQTNILALNAAVEAARAGEAGMGFAVVADEVRNLAQRSAEAARETALLIEESVASASEGNRMVGEVATSIGAVAGSVAEVKGLVDQVASASQQQAQGIGQVTQAVSQMESVTQTAAATAEESAAASEELSAQAESTMAIVVRLDALVSGRQDVAPAAVPHAPAARRTA